MFNNKIKVKFHTERQGGYSNSETVGLSINSFLSYLQKLSDKFGKIIIERVDLENNVVHLTTQDSLEFTRVDQKMAEITNLLRDYVIDK